jgi:hypothetical protein
MVSNGTLTANPTGLALQPTITQRIADGSLRLVASLVVSAPSSRNLTILSQPMGQLGTRPVIRTHFLNARKPVDFDGGFVALLASRENVSIELSRFSALRTDGHD